MPTNLLVLNNYYFLFFTTSEAIFYQNKAFAVLLAETPYTPNAVLENGQLTGHKSYQLNQFNISFLHLSNVPQFRRLITFNAQEKINFQNTFQCF